MSKRKVPHLPGYVAVVEHDGTKAVYAMSEWLGMRDQPQDGQTVTMLATLQAMLAWSAEAKHRIAPKPKPDEAQISRIAEMLTRND